jgi:hypothetical protein
MLDTNTRREVQKTFNEVIQVVCTATKEAVRLYFSPLLQAYKFLFPRPK